MLSYTERQFRHMYQFEKSGWRHQMDAFSRYWPFVQGIHRSLVNFPQKAQWRGALMICALNKRLSKQCWGWWFESLWRHCKVYIDFLAFCPHLVISVHFYPRPVLAFGYFHCLRLCVCVYVSVCVITKLGTKVQNTLIKVSTVLWNDWPWFTRWNLTLKSTFALFCAFLACLRDKSPPIEVRISKFGLKMHVSTVKIPLDLGIDWSRSSLSFFISNLLFLLNFASLIHLRYLVYI